MWRERCAVGMLAAAQEEEGPFPRDPWGLGGHRSTWASPGPSCEMNVLLLWEFWMQGGQASQREMGLPSWCPAQGAREQLRHWLSRAVVFCKLALDACPGLAAPAF